MNMRWAAGVFLSRRRGQQVTCDMKFTDTVAVISHILILFALFINDLAKDLNEKGKGIQIGELNLSILMYADDVVLLSDNHSNAQLQLDIMTKWCSTWGMFPNIKKSQVVHHRNPQKPRCRKVLKLSGENMEFVSDYKYLGCWINEFGNDKKTVEALTAAAGRSFGRIIGLFKQLGNMGYRSYCTLYDTYVIPVANYAAGVWGFKSHSAPQVLQHRVNRFYLGVHRYTANAATSIEMDIIDIRFARWLEVLRYYNRICELEEDRLPRLILEWDIENKGKGWITDVRQIDFTVLYDLENIKKSLLSLSRTDWWKEASTKSKLKFYCDYKDRSDPTLLACTNISRMQRSLLAKLYSSTLPLQVEIGRFTNVDKEDRLCTVCNENKIEDEYHFLFSCAPLQWERSMYYTNHIQDIGTFMLWPDASKVSYLTSKPMIKSFAEYVEFQTQKFAVQIFLSTI